MSRVNAGEPAWITSPARENGPSLQLYIIFTNIEATKTALETARYLARDLNAGLVLLVAQVVPYPLPLDEPPVAGAFTTGLLSELAAEQNAAVTVHLYLCRDRDVTIRRALEPRSLVVIGRDKPRWLSWAAVPRLARQLQRDGHEVILPDISRIHPTRRGSMNVELSR